MTDYQRIYREHAADYDALVNAEDVDQNLLPAIARVARVKGAILEVGVGTGRISRLLAPRAGRFVGVEREASMLEIARAHLERLHLAHPAELLVGDARTFPVEEDFADLAIAGWVFGHFRTWFPEGWKDEVSVAIDRMESAVLEGGTTILIETLGTGSEVPSPPRPELAEYYAWLEGDLGFTRTTLRTDYRFPDLEGAARITGLFFGPSFEARLREEVAARRWTEGEAIRIPECTGLWWRK